MLHRSDSKENNQLKIFLVSSFPDQFDKNISISTTNHSKSHQEKIIKKAIDFHLLGDIPEATKCYKFCLENGFNDSRVFANYALILKELGKFNEAESLLRKSIEINPDSAEPYSNLGNILRDVGKLKDAEILLRKAIEINPYFAEAYSNLGNLLRELGKCDEAELFTRKAIEIKPEFLTAYFNLINILKDLEKINEAELFACKAIELKPDSADAHFNHAEILNHLGKLEEAESAIRNAIKLQPDYFSAYLSLGNFLRDLGKLKEAEIVTRKLIKLQPNLSAAYSNLGNILRDIGKLKEAEQESRKAIRINPNCAYSYCNLSSIIKDLGKLKEAELLIRKAINLDPNLAIAYSNLGAILIDLGEINEAELVYLKAIEIQPDLAKPYLFLSKVQSLKDDEKCFQYLFSEKILKNKLKIDLVDIYFARSNFLHNKKKYEESARYLKLANKIKLEIKSSNSDLVINTTKILFFESYQKKNIKKYNSQIPQSIFIVGMPRSGSTLVESILSMNINVHDLGEIDLLRQSVIELKKTGQKLSLADLYWKGLSEIVGDFDITTNKMLYNYQYVGYILDQIPNSKIIHCFRNPLDNILSIFRAHFANGNEFSSSLIDCAKVYLDQDNIMTEFKTRFQTAIYDLNYDLLVREPRKEIKSLIDWLAWDWNESYLLQHLNLRPVSTASNIQIRSPINSKSIGGWKNYKNMLLPAIKVLEKSKKHKEIIFC